MFCVWLFVGYAVHADFGFLVVFGVSPCDHWLWWWRSCDLACCFWMVCLAFIAGWVRGCVVYGVSAAMGVL